ncbi:haloacid dehalogenase superfamily, subfamily IA, variant 3 with third motif having DD or ED/haloacid dehalogenase superfamily, subfamily IA, variant 1 with third motif having Dx(3-4)D or Dx(3-4)E/beta-phosphoglucomutase family hydrolase [Flexibacter flexilis DSM 6793]|uniref:Haloacid dehalogenase superfamily, subfamily IA, variant 3 with third motif having DD or ED/beta-phosphoglucomutase family hydrolase n=1 Tax=Flexibacter flexilis DSM 6793 TaxID=927664 RepID=A0A1I1L413_9BACT|nr:HAD family phosphatase [Flexibacter flexilis]SFC67695.1 haloacid dehalogenase superfamily, subfamily IA, variant 3 with third motif having DD or ED/haloacid dehalogenase superfamily, subfamily IA, variant 1 with third motif having Dx(3-4)D or Dx(3-4)E/beta-phosphoglucomutase family hydrolase [Flexibacter flexilis DSM 6793]
MKVKAFIFDMDGTLINNISYHQKAWLAFLAKYGIELAPHEFHAQNHGTQDELIRHFFGQDLDYPKVQALGNEKEALYRELYRPAMEPLKGLPQLLDALKAQQIRIALATMGGADNIDFVLDTLQIRPYFEVIVGGHQVRHGKPHPEVYQKALKALGLEPSEAIALEDSRGGIVSANGAGLPVVGITTSHTPDELRQWGAIHTVAHYENFPTKSFL